MFRVSIHEGSDAKANDLPAKTNQGRALRACLDEVQRHSFRSPALVIHSGPLRRLLAEIRPGRQTLRLPPNDLHEPHQAFQPAVHFLAPCSPELNRVEMLWRLAKKLRPFKLLEMAELRSAIKAIMRKYFK